MKKNSTKSLLACAVLASVLGSGNVQAAQHKIVIAPGSLVSGQTIEYGNYYQSSNTTKEPIIWDVLSNNGKTISAFSQKVLERVPMGSMAAEDRMLDEFAKNFNYNNAAWMKNAFSVQEAKAFGNTLGIPTPDLSSGFTHTEYNYYEWYWYWTGSKKKEDVWEDDWVYVPDPLPVLIGIPKEKWKAENTAHCNYWYAGTTMYQGARYGVYALFTTEKWPHVMTHSYYVLQMDNEGNYYACQNEPTYNYNYYALDIGLRPILNLNSDYVLFASVKGGKETVGVGGLAVLPEVTNTSALELTMNDKKTGTARQTGDVQLTQLNLNGAVLNVDYKGGLYKDDKSYLSYFVGEGDAAADYFAYGKASVMSKGGSGNSGSIDLAPVKDNALNGKGMALTFFNEYGSGTNWAGNLAKLPGSLTFDEDGNLIYTAGIADIGLAVDIGEKNILRVSDTSYAGVVSAPKITGRGTVQVDGDLTFSGANKAFQGTMEALNGHTLTLEGDELYVSVKGKVKLEQDTTFKGTKLAGEIFSDTGKKLILDKDLQVTGDLKIADLDGRGKTLDMRQVEGTASYNTLTIGTLWSDADWAIDLGKVNPTDTEFTSDKIVLNGVDSGAKITLNAINLIDEPSLASLGDTKTINGVVTDNVGSSVVVASGLEAYGANYKYTVSLDDGNLVLMRGGVNTDGFKTFVKSTNTASYSFVGDTTLDEPLTTGDGSESNITKTVFFNNHELQGSSTDGITVADTHTLVMKGGTVTGFAIALNNVASGGTLNLQDMTITGNTTDVANAGTMNIGGNVTIGTLTGSGTTDIGMGGKLDLGSGSSQDLTQTFIGDGTLNFIGDATLAIKNLGTATNTVAGGKTLTFTSSGTDADKTLNKAVSGAGKIGIGNGTEIITDANNLQVAEVANAGTLKIKPASGNEDKINSLKSNITGEGNLELHGFNETHGTITQSTVTIAENSTLDAYKTVTANIINNGAAFFFVKDLQGNVTNSDSHTPFTAGDSTLLNGLVALYTDNENRTLEKTITNGYIGIMGEVIAPVDNLAGEVYIAGGHTLTVQGGDGTAKEILKTIQGANEKLPGYGNGSLVTEGKLNATLDNILVPLENKGTMNLNNGSTNHNMDKMTSIINSGTMNVSEGITLDGSVTNSGIMNISEGIIFDGSIDNSGIMNISEGVILNGTINNSGTMTVELNSPISGDAINSGTLNLKSNLSGNTLLNTGMVNMEDAAHFENGARIVGGTVNVKGDLTATAENLFVEIINIDDNKTLKISGIPALRSDIYSILYGKVNSENGTLEITAGNLSALNVINSKIVLDDNVNLNIDADNTKRDVEIGNNANLNLGDGVLDAGTITNNNGTVNFNGTTEVNSTLSGSGTFNNNGELTVADIAYLDIPELNNTGIVNIGNYTYQTLNTKINGTLGIVGNITAAADKLAVNEINIDEGKSLTVNGITPLGEMLIVNEGTLDLGITGNPTLNALIYGGTVKITEDVSTIGTNLLDGNDNNMNVQIAENKTLTITGENLTVAVGDSTNNKGTVKFTGTTGAAKKIYAAVEVEATNGALTVAADLLKNASNTNDGTLTLTGDNKTLSGNISGSGSTNVEGTVTVAQGKSITQSGLTIKEGKSLTAEVDSLTIGGGTGTIANEGTLTLKGDGTTDTLEESVTGTAGTLTFDGNNRITANGAVTQTTVNINADVDMNNTLTAAVTVAEGKTLTIAAGNLLGVVTNSGTVELEAGTLGNYDITGGAIKISGNVEAAVTNLNSAEGITANAGSNLTLTGTGTLADDITGAGNVAIGNGTETATITADFADLDNEGTLTVNTKGTLVAGGTLDKDIAGAGTVKLNGITELYDEKRIESTLDGNGQYVTLVGIEGNDFNTFTVGKLAGTTNLTIDVDMSNGDSDKIIANEVDGGATLTVTNINIRKDYILGSLGLPVIKDDGIIFVDTTSTNGTYKVGGSGSITALTNSYKYTFEKGSVNGKLKYIIEEHAVTLKEFIEGNLSEGDDPQILSLTDDKGYSDTAANLGAATQTNDEITININGHKLAADNGSTPMTVSTGDRTLNINGGTGTSDEGYTDLLFNVQNGGKLAVSGNTELGGNITNAGTVTFDGITTANGTLAGAGDYTNSGTLNIADGGKLQMTKGLTNSGILNLTAGTLTAEIKGTDGEVNINGTVTGTKNIANDVNVASTGNFTNSGTISGAVTNNGAMNNNNSGIISGAVTNNGAMNTAANGITGGVTNNSNLILTGGDLGSAITGRGFTDITGVVSNSGNQVIAQEALTIASGGALTTNADALVIDDNVGTIINKGNLTLTGGTLQEKLVDATGSLTIDGDVVALNDITQKDLTIKDDRKLDMATEGKKLTVTNDINNQGTLTIGASELQSRVANSGTVALKDGTLANGKTVSGGKITVDGAVTAGVGDLLSGAGIANAGGTLTLTGEGELADNITGAGETIIKGTITNGKNIENKVTVSADKSLINSGTISGAVENDGNLINSGTVSGAITNNGAMNTAANGITGGVTNNSNLILTGGDLGSAITGRGFTDITGGVSNSGNHVIAQEALTILPGGALTTDTTALVIGDNEGIIRNDGTLTLKGDGTTDTLQESVTGTAGTLTFEGNNRITATGAITQTTVNISADVDMNNTLTAAVKVAEGKTLTIAAGNLLGAVTNSGTVALKDGTLANGKTVSGGKITVDGAVTAGVGDLLSGAGIANAGGTLTLTGEGELADNITGAGETIIKGTITNGKNIENKVTVSADKSFTNSGNVSGPVTNAGNFTNRGNISGDLTNSGILDNTEGILNGTVSNNPGGTLNTKLEGISNWSGGNVSNGGTLNIAGGGELKGQNLANTGTVNLEGIYTVSRDVIDNSGTGITITGGTINVASTSKIDLGRLTKGDKGKTFTLYDFTNATVAGEDGSWATLPDGTYTDKTCDVITSRTLKQFTIINGAITLNAVGSNFVPKDGEEDGIRTTAYHVANAMAESVDGNITKFIDGISNIESASGTGAASEALNASMNIGEAGGVQHGAVNMAGYIGEAIGSNMSIISRPILSGGQQATMKNMANDGDVKDAKIEEIEVAKANEIMPVAYQEQKYEKTIWASYMHNKENINGLQLDGVKQNGTAQYNGTTVGADLWSSGKVIGGVAIAYSTGDVNSTIGLASTKNEAKYYGVSVYNRWTNGSTGILADVGYMHSKNELTQHTVESELTADAKINSFTAGVRAEQLVKLGRSNLVPFAGVRYMRLRNGEYTLSENGSNGRHFAPKNQNIITPQVGVAWNGEFTIPGSKWTFRPSVEVGYLWNLGDRDTESLVSFGGANDTIGYEVADKSSYYGKLGMDFRKDNVILGVSYKYQKGDAVKNRKWNFNVNYNFGNSKGMPYKSVLLGKIDLLENANKALRAENVELKAENVALKAENVEVKAENERLKALLGMKNK